MIAVPLALLFIAVVCDLRSRDIPDALSLLMLAWAAVVVVCSANGWNPGGLTWGGAVAGLGIGFALAFPLFALGGLGGGDVKLIAALGAAVGPLLLLQTLFWTAIAGGLIAFVVKLRGQKDFAYVPAIFAGLIGALVLSPYF